MLLFPSEIDKKSFAVQHSTIEQILLGADNEQVAPFLERVGYTSSKISDAKDRLSELWDLHLEYKNRKCDKESLRNKRDEMIHDAHRVSGLTRKVLKTVLETDSGLHQELGIDSVRAKKSHVNNWIEQHELFYRNMNGEVRKILKNFGYDNLRIAEEKKAVAAIVSIEKERIGVIAEVNKLRVQRNVRLKELQEWLSDFLKLAQIATSHDPMLMRYLSVKTRETEQIISKHDFGDLSDE